jgi:hypothetical protein
VVLHLNSHKSLKENEEQTKAKTRGVLTEREKIRAKKLRILKSYITVFYHWVFNFPIKRE